MCSKKLKEGKIKDTGEVVILSHEKKKIMSSCLEIQFTKGGNP